MSAKGAVVHFVDAALESDSVPSCPVCGKQGEELYAQLVDWLFGVSGSWSLRSCSTCGIAWPYPQPAAEDISRLYARYYTHSSAPKKWLGLLRQEMAQSVFARMGYRVPASSRILPRLLAYAPSEGRAAALEAMGLAPIPEGKLLDVGCGNGDFIERMRGLGWNVSGVDPDPAAVNQGRSRGLQILGGTIADVPDEPCFDVITLNHVIEHVADPQALLRECGRRLRPHTGIVVVTTPNINSLGHRWFRRYWRGLEVPRHLILFSPRALSDCILRSGLDVHTLRTETRLARMIYVPSVYARKGTVDVGEKTSFKLSTRLAAYGFQFLENALALVRHDMGEEVYCVCTAPKGSDGKQD